MGEFNDIYFKVDSRIVEQGFWQASIVEKKALIDKELKLYALEKLREVNWDHYLLNNQNTNLSINDIVAILASDINKEEHINTIRHFVHYILLVAGSLQDRSITWWIEEDEELIKTPYIDFNANGFWENLITHKETDYVQIFNFVYEIFNRYFLADNNYKRLRLKSDILKNKE